MKNLLTTFFGIVWLGITLVSAQINDSPAGAYQWKKGKTEFQDGYVVLKSGKKMEGKISLKGSAENITEIAYEGGGKSLDFPVGSLKSFGLSNVDPNASSTVSGAPINESPESMYQWRSMGIVMGKEIHSTTPRPGYVVLKNGTRYDGELKLRKKAGVLEDFEIKTATGKEKADFADVARYGYTISEEEVKQINLAKEIKKSFPGSIQSGQGNSIGEITLQRIQGKPYFERIIFKDNGGQLADHTTKTITGFIVNNKGTEEKYIAVGNVFVEERFNGKTFQVYLNPEPTSINKFATSLVKNAIGIGTTATASAIAANDQKKNNYTSNLDSVIRVSSTDDLIALRDEISKLAGYENVNQALEKSDNESLKANLSALELAIQGREAANTPGGILNKEWIILNKISNEKTIVYKAEYKDQIEVLLMGCDKYLELSKGPQNDFRKWDNLEQTILFLDGCY